MPGELDASAPAVSVPGEVQQVTQVTLILGMLVASERAGFALCLYGRWLGCTLVGAQGIGAHYLCPSNPWFKSMCSSSSMPLTLDTFFKPKDAKQGEPAPGKEPASVAKQPTPEPPAAASREARCESAKADSAPDEQEFIDFFLKVAKSPIYKGNPMKSRRVAVFGKKYYWGDDVTHGLEKLPISFRKWCAHKKYTGHNCVLVNVYDEKESNIGWHCDDTRNLSNPEVVSVSFSSTRKHRDKDLAVMEFRWTDKTDKTKKIVKKETLSHGTVVRFDAVKHKKKTCEHRVARTAFPRVNVTLRSLK